MSEKKRIPDTAARLDGVGEYFFSRKLREIDMMRAAGQEIINLGVGGPDLPPHPDVIKTLCNEACKPGTHCYQPNKGTILLRNAFSKFYAEKYGVTLDPATEILPLAGSKEGLMHIFMTYLNIGDKVLVPNPGYPIYRSAATLSGGVCIDYTLLPENDWKPDLDAIERNGLDGVKILVANYPHMPTGAFPDEELFREIVKFAKKHKILVVHDNPYSFIRNPQQMSMLSVKGAKDVVIELNSLSKSHNMAGWRIGIVCGEAGRIDEIMRFRSNMDSGIFFPLQAAAAVAMGLDQTWYDELNATYYARQEKAWAIMDFLGCSYTHDQAGLFLWGCLPAGAKGDCYTWSDRLLYDCGVFITPGGIFGNQGDRSLRISLCSPESELEKALEKIKNKLFTHE